MAKRSKRFPLLLYKRYHQVNSGLSKFLIGLGVFLLIGIVAIKLFVKPDADPQEIRLALLGSAAVSVLGVLRFLFTFMVSKTAYTECRPKSLKIQTPFLPLVVSYHRIQNTRPAMLRDLFPPDKQKRNRNLLETFWGETVVIVEINKMPMSPKLLQTVMGPFMLEPGGAGLALLVEDWMGFSQSLDQALTAYRTQRASAGPGRGFYPPR